MVGLNPDHSLPRSKILRGKRNFQRLFERSTVLKKSSLLCKYRTYKNPEEKCLFGFIAPKKVFRHAVQRNKIKRWMREAFRTNQHKLPREITQNTIGFHAVFIATSADLTFKDINQRMISLLDAIADSFSINKNQAGPSRKKKTD